MAQPLVTVAIPHYKHPQHLALALESLFRQTFEDFEILVSDDASPDDSAEVIPEMLERSDRRFVYFLQEGNLGYDGNVRFCLSQASGSFVFLLGNDDGLPHADTLSIVASDLTLTDPDVAFTNYRLSGAESVVSRASATVVLGEGVETALRHFRSFSFVSGLVFRRSAAAEHDTPRWDRSVYYQIYLATRIVAAGGRMAALDCCAVEKDLSVDGRRATTYADALSRRPQSVSKVQTGLNSVIDVAVDAVAPYASEPLGRVARRVAQEILQTSYLHWLLDYRRVAGWTAAIGAARDLWPRPLTRRFEMSTADCVRLWCWYLATSAFGLLAPRQAATLGPTMARVRRRASQRR